MICFSVKIADVVFGICANYPETKAFFAHFSSEEQEEHQITVSAEDIAFYRRQFPQFTDALCERAVVKYRMDKLLVDHGAFPFHASALSFLGEAYVFTALSGVGKSTHARLWQQAFADDVVMINDDRPYIKVVGDRAYAYSHPQSGKHHIYTNTAAPIRVIGKIVRDRQNFVKPISKAAFFPFFVQQTFTMDEAQTTAKIIALQRKVLDCVRLYEIHCNTDPDAGAIICRQLCTDMNCRTTV